MTPVIRHNLLLHLNKSAEEFSSVLSILGAMMKVYSDETKDPDANVKQMSSLLVPLLYKCASLQTISGTAGAPPPDESVVISSIVLEYLSCLTNESLSQMIVDTSLLAPPVFVPMKVIGVEGDAKCAEIVVDTSSYDTLTVSSHDLMILMSDLLNKLCVDPPFPKSWRAFRYACLANLLKLLTVVEPILKNSYVSKTSFDSGVVTQFFKLSEVMIRHPLLQIDTLLASDRKLLLDSYGDMRHDAAHIMNRVWLSLDTNQMHYIPALTGMFLELTAYSSPILRRLGINLYFSQLHREFHTTGSFKGVEHESVDVLDRITASGKAGNDYIDYFNTELNALISTDAALRDKGKVYLDGMYTCDIANLHFRYEANAYVVVGY